MREPLPRQTGGARFSADERHLVEQALEEAESETARYYCIPPRHWHDLPYDVLTQGDHDSRVLPERVLAETVRLEKIAPARERAFGFYRIQLNDGPILETARREGRQSDLHPLLVYILTHEMVHLVRLGAILDASSLHTLTRELEEQRVERICNQILARSPNRSLTERLRATNLCG